MFEVAAIALFRHAPQFGNAGRFAKSEVKELRSADRLLALERTEELGPLLIKESGLLNQNMEVGGSTSAGGGSVVLGYIEPVASDYRKGAACSEVTADSKSTISVQRDTCD